MQIEEMEQLVQAINLAVHHKEELAKVKDASQRITSYSMGDFPRGWEEVKSYSLLLTAVYIGLCPCSFFILTCNWT